MKRSWLLSLAIAATCLMTSASAFAQVCFYEHANYSGASFCLNRNDSMSFVGNGWNDKISSISFHDNATARVCEHIDFGGTCRIYDRNVPNLSNEGFNDIISSIEIYGNFGGPGRPGPRPPRPPASQSACFYEHAHFGGASVCLSPGQQVNNLARHGYNDVISSIRVPFGVEVEVCEHANFGGRCEYINGDVYNFADWGFNDTISSIRVYGGRGGRDRFSIEML